MHIYKIYKSTPRRHEAERAREVALELDRRKELLRLEEEALRAQWALEEAERQAKLRALQQRREEAVRVDGELAAQVCRWH